MSKKQKHIGEYAGGGEMGMDTLGVLVHVQGLLLLQANKILSCGFTAAYILMQPNEFPSLQLDLLLTVK